MKILRVISSMHPSVGGPCQGIRNSIPALRSLGVENEVVCFDPVDMNYNVIDDFIIHQLGPSYTPYSFCPKLRSWLVANVDRFDVVIIHGLWLYNSFGTYSFLSKLKGKFQSINARLFVMPHGMLDPYFQTAPDRKLKALRNKIFWKFFEKNVINGSSGVLFTCQRELELARKTFPGYSPKRELNVGYGVQPAPPYTKQMEVAFWQVLNLQKVKYLLFLSRVHEKKGVDLLIDAYIQIKDSDFGCELPILVIAGPLDNEFAKLLVARYSARIDVIFAGMLQGDSKWGAIYGCEAFILPSHQENFGIAVVEAMACGKPVAISDQVNIYTVIEECDAGYVFNDNLASTRNIISLLTKDMFSGILERKGKNAKVAYETYFKPEGAAKRLLESLCQR